MLLGAGGASASASTTPSLITLLIKMTLSMPVSTYCQTAILQLKVYTGVPDANQKAAIMKNLEARPYVLDFFLQLSALHPTATTIEILEKLAIAEVPHDKLVSPHEGKIHFPQYKEGNPVANHFEVFMRIAKQYNLPPEDWVVSAISTFNGGSAQDNSIQWLNRQKPDEVLNWENFRMTITQQLDGRNQIADSTRFEMRQLGPNEPIPDYTNALRAIAPTAFPGYSYEQREDQVARQFRRGLTGELRNEVIKCDLFSIDELMAKAIAIQTRLGPGCRNGPSGIVSYAEETESLAPIAATPGRQRRAPAPAPAPAAAPAKEKKMQVRDPNKKCDHCHRVGHVMADCWTLHPEKKPARIKAKDGASGGAIPKKSKNE